jgi:hypothetical protein
VCLFVSSSALGRSGGSNGVHTLLRARRCGFAALQICQIHRMKYMRFNCRSTSWKIHEPEHLIFDPLLIVFESLSNSCLSRLLDSLIGSLLDNLLLLGLSVDLLPYVEKAKFLLPFAWRLHYFTVCGSFLDRNLAVDGLNTFGICFACPIKLGVSGYSLQSILVYVLRYSHCYRGLIVPS